MLPHGPLQFRAVGDDEGVVGAQCLQDLRDPALPPRRPAGGDLFDETHLSQVVLVGKVQDVRLVLFDVLIQRRHPQISKRCVRRRCRHPRHCPALR
jgi:hypothetical protein